MSLVQTMPNYLTENKVRGVAFYEETVMRNYNIMNAFKLLVDAWEPKGSIGRQRLGGFFEPRRILLMDDMDGAW